MTEEYGIVDVKKLVQQHDQLRQVCEDLKLQLAGKEDEKAILRQELEALRQDRDAWKLCADEMRKTLEACEIDRRHWHTEWRLLKTTIAEMEESIPPVYTEIVSERREQDKQWGGPEHDDTHEPLDWLSFIEKQAKKAVAFTGTYDNGKWIKGASDDYRLRMIKIAALAIAAAESCDRKGVGKLLAKERERIIEWFAADNEGGKGLSREYLNECSDARLIRMAELSKIDYKQESGEASE